MKVPETEYIDADGPPLRLKEITAIMARIFKEKTGHTVEHEAAKQIYEAIFQVAFSETVRCGEFRLPLGLGRLWVKWRKARRYRPFGGPDHLVPDRGYIKYSEGNTTREMLGRAVEYQRQKPRELPVENIYSPDTESAE